MTSRELKETNMNEKRSTSKSPLPQRRVTVTSRKLSKDSSTELIKEKPEVLSRIATRIKISSDDKNPTKTPSPFYRKPDKSPRNVPVKAIDHRFVPPKEDFLAELEKELASLTGED